MFYQESGSDTEKRDPGLNRKRNLDLQGCSHRITSFFPGNLVPFYIVKNCIKMDKTSRTCSIIPKIRQTSQFGKLVSFNPINELNLIIRKIIQRLNISGFLQNHHLHQHFIQSMVSLLDGNSEYLAHVWRPTNLF